MADAPRYPGAHDGPLSASSRVQTSRRYRMGLAGWLFISLTTLMGLGAANAQNNLLFFLFGVALASVIFSGLFSGMMLMNIHARRILPDTARVGEPLPVRYRVWNTSRFLPAFALTISELTPEEAQAALPAHTNSWQRTCAQVATYLNHLKARGNTTTPAPVTPEQRGQITFTAFEVSSSFPFGLITKSIVFHQQATLTVRPRAIELGTLPQRRSPGEGQTDAQSRRDQRNAGDAFYGLREYAPGDPLRMIAWKASARAHTLVTRQQQETIREQMWVELDPLGSASNTDEQRERAIAQAAGVVERCIGRSISVGVSIPSFGVALAPDSTRAHLHTVLDTLGRLDLHNPPTDLPAVAFTARGAHRIAPSVGVSKRASVPKAHTDKAEKAGQA